MSDEESDETPDVAEYAANFRASAAKLDGNPHGSFLSGVRHGYLMAADAMDEMTAELDRLRARHSRADSLLGRLTGLLDSYDRSSLSVDASIGRSLAQRRRHALDAAREYLEQS